MPMISLWSSLSQDACQADWASEPDSSVILMSGNVRRGWIWTSARMMA